MTSKLPKWIRVLVDSDTEFLEWRRRLRVCEGILGVSKSGRCIWAYDSKFEFCV